MERTARSRPRIAIVDDERPYAWAVAFALGDDYEVTPLPCARDLLGRIERGEEYDLILADVLMPEMGGFQMLGILRAVAPGQADRVFFVTSLDPTDVAVPQDLAARVSDKPLSVSELATLVAERLRQVA
jgi:CheY-like chemotaxis protein